MFYIDNVTTDPLLNMVEKIDRLANEYKEKKTPQTLLEFVHFRKDCIKVISHFWLMGIYPMEKGWNCNSYIEIVTDELGIFHDKKKKVKDEEHIRKIKKWRERLNR